MSPRAAWRLEATGFGPAYDYAAGKMDWLAAGLPYEGTAELAGRLARRGVAAVAEDTPAAEALRLLDAQGFGPVLVLNQAGVVMGAAHRDSLAAAGDSTAGSVMRFGVSTVCGPAKTLRRWRMSRSSFGVKATSLAAPASRVLPTR